MHVGDLARTTRIEIGSRQTGSWQARRPSRARWGIVGKLLGVMRVLYHTLTVSSLLCVGAPLIPVSQPASFSFSEGRGTEHVITEVPALGGIFFLELSWLAHLLADV
uniref:Uncharacterized protein n=1 Tax=Anopheles maculatus TaxID=74869 RepID=A0A182SX93_9DIPT